MIDPTIIESAVVVGLTALSGVVGNKLRTVESDLQDLLVSSSKVVAAAEVNQVDLADLKKAIADMKDIAANI